MSERRTIQTRRRQQGQRVQPWFVAVDNWYVEGTVPAVIAQGNADQKWFDSVRGVILPAPCPYTAEWAARGYLMADPSVSRAREIAVALGCDPPAVVSGSAVPVGGLSWHEAIKRHQARQKRDAELREAETNENPDGLAETG